uniref:THUMP domain-containing protein 1 n=1 Tax=Nothobranchius rachovii TaxID=451742 RepID=A0A1A8S6C1_9TELE
MSAVQNESRKRNKKRYMSGHHKRFKRSGELEVGMQGILITCNNKNQRPCTAEALDLLSEYADQLYGPELQDNSEPTEEKEDEEEDVDDALKKEVAQLKAQRTNEERRFQVLDSGAFNVIFIRTRNIDPNKLVHYILTDLYTTKKKKSRLILRMLPVIGTCRAYQEDIVKYLTTFLVPWFKAPNSTTYKIAYKARNNNQNKREEIIKHVAGVLGSLNQENKVDLTNPELTVIVEVIKAVCCVCVVKDYQLYRKFNVYEIVKEDVPKPAVVATNTDAEELSKGESEKVEEKTGEKESQKEKIDKGAEGVQVEKRADGCEDNEVKKGEDGGD